MAPASRLGRQIAEVVAILNKLGYRCLQRTAEVGNYVRGDERVDLLYASRPIAQRLLAGAQEVDTSLGELRVISTEKPADYHLVAEGGVAPQPRTSTDPYAELDDLMVVIEALCPRWPERPLFNRADRFIL